MLNRLLLDDLLRWKQKTCRKPVLIDGARQVGKTFLVERLFGPASFRKVHSLDFRREPGLCALFADSLDPREIVEKIELAVDSSVDLERDLIFFDEVGDCQRALDSLKYFDQDLSGAYVCASGSNIGLLQSFPVGSVHSLELFPLGFEEFLMGHENPRLLQAYRGRSRGRIEHGHLWSALLDHYFVGGMPAAVQGWMDRSSRLRERVQTVTSIHRDLLRGFARDFGKYAGKLHAQHIDAVWRNVPRQLARDQDGSVRRFRFKGVIPRKRGYRDLAGPIEWLHSAKLVRKCYPVKGSPRAPLMAHVRHNMFRLYFFDTGLLGHAAGLTYEDQRSQGVSYKGFIAENFVQNELGVRVAYPTFGWQQAQAEIEFLHRCQDGEIIPVQVKSGARTRARSLRSFVHRYSPRRAVKLVGSRGGKDGGVIETWPLYDAQFLREL